MKETFKKLRDLYKIDKSREIFLQVIEFFIFVYTGGLIEAWISSDNEFNKKTITIVASIFTTGFLVFRLARQFYLPESTIDYIENKQETENTKKELSRKTTIDIYIEEAIKTLNAKTCGLNNGDHNHLCDTSLDDGIRNVLKHIISHTHYFLDCNLSKFSVFVHFTKYPNINNNFDIAYSSRTIMLRDDFNVVLNFKDDILENSTTTNFNLEIYQSALKAYNHYKGISSTFEHFKGQSMITSPIPAVCENSCNGLLFVIFDTNSKIPDDVWNIFLIFGRIASNYISKYEDCANSRKNLSLLKELISKNKILENDKLNI
jgi:hypothetical protein